LRGILTPAAGPYEVVLVDEASGPRTRQAVRALAQQFPEVRVVRLQRHLGEAAALAIGASHARGEVLLTLDPYLHVALEELPKLLAPLADGTDLVCAWRYPRHEQGLSRLASDAFNAAARWLTKVPVHDLNCRTRAMRREVLQELPLYGDLHRFIPIFAARRGFTWREIQLPQQPGKHEVGAWHLRSYLGRALDLLTLAFLTRFVRRPLHFFGLVGAASLAAGVGLATLLAYQRLFLDMGIGHRPMLLLAILLIVVGIQIGSIGLLGELMIFTHARDQKDYVVREEAP
jgi:glycosyltransferase involved in cell wall biosynthesis